MTYRYPEFNKVICLGGKLVKNVFKSKLSFLITGLLIVAVVAVPFIVNSAGSSEKGLLGLALDPNFATNGYMYVSYTTLDEHAQLSRFTVVNDTASLSSEVVYLKGDQLQNPHHSANDVHIGPDGKLWWAVGDNVPSISNGE